MKQTPFHGTPSRSAHNSPRGASSSMSKTPRKRTKLDKLNPDIKIGSLIAIDVASGSFGVGLEGVKSGDLGIITHTLPGIAMYEIYLFRIKEQIKVWSSEFNVVNISRKHHRQQ